MKTKEDIVDELLARYLAARKRRDHEDDRCVELFSELCAARGQ